LSGALHNRQAKTTCREKGFEKACNGKSETVNVINFSTYS
jgi:hypothetical protein